MSSKKIRKECPGCREGFRTKDKKRRFCDKCVRGMGESKVIQKRGDAILVHAGDVRKTQNSDKIQLR